jgi:hypothetical protein
MSRSGPDPPQRAGGKRVVFGTADALTALDLDEFSAARTIRRLGT